MRLVSYSLLSLSPDNNNTISCYLYYYLQISTNIISRYLEYHNMSVLRVMKENNTAAVVFIVVIIDTIAADTTDDTLAGDDVCLCARGDPADPDQLDERVLGGPGAQVGVGAERGLVSNFVFRESGRLVVHHKEGEGAVHALVEGPHDDDRDNAVDI